MSRTETDTLAPPTVVITLAVAGSMICRLVAAPYSVPSGARLDTPPGRILRTARQRSHRRWHGCPLVDGIEDLIGRAIERTVGSKCNALHNDPRPKRSDR